jgi:uncharacterized membrane protein
MARDVGDVIGRVVQEALKNTGGMSPAKKSSPLSGARGVAAGAGLAALAPLAKKGVDTFRASGSGNGHGLASKAGDKIGSHMQDTVSKKVDEAGGAGGLAKQAAGGLFSSSDDGGGSGGGMPGVGKGRRMPVQQSVDVAVPIETAYNQFTQFEDWPNFMHRVTRVTQDEPEKLSFATKIWGKTKEFTADIETQRPDERIKWRVSQGITHTGVATFHELAPRLTRIEINLDVDPGSLIEKAARGMRHIKRAVRADLARYKAFIEMQELETGAWRGVIEDGEVVEDHDDSYDEERDYSDIDDLENEASGSEDDSDDEGHDGNGSSRQRSERFKRQAQRSTSSGRRSSPSKQGSSRQSSGSKQRSTSRAASASRKSASPKQGAASSARKRSSAKQGSSKPASSSSGRSRSGGGSGTRKRTTQSRSRS